MLIKAMQSPSHSLYATVPSNSQSASFISTKIPGRSFVVSSRPIINMSRFRLMYSVST